MSEPTVLLLGANGQLGHELRRVLSDRAPLVALDVPDIDFRRPDSLRATVRDIRPAVIVNAAAYTAVDPAESHFDDAFAINAAAPGVLALAAEELGARLVHYSTDYVFDGTKRTAYVESDAPGPLSVYGASKLEGELAVVRCKRNLVFRTSWVVGAHGNNFVKTILRLAAERESLRVVFDQIGAPTPSRLLAEMTGEVLAASRNWPADDARWGLYHLAPAGETSWHNLACYVVDRARSMGVPLLASSGSIEAITTSEYKAAATRPGNSRLDTSKFRSVFGLTLPAWENGIDALLEQLVPDMLP